MTGRLVVGVDSSLNSKAAVRWAMDEARRRDLDVEAVSAWHVPYDSTGLMPIAVDPAPIELAVKQALDDAIAACDTELAPSRVTKRVVSGSAIVALDAASQDAQLLVVGSRGLGGFVGLLVGSVAEHCLHHAECPVAVVPAASPSPSGRTVVGVDGSPESLSALTWAVDRATPDETIVALSAWSWLDQPALTFEIDYDHHAVEAHLLDLFDEHGIDRGAIEIESCNDLPASALVNRSEQGDLVVIGSRGQGLVKRVLLGSVARQVTRHSPGPVIVHR